MLVLISKLVFLQSVILQRPTAANHCRTAQIWREKFLCCPVFKLGWTFSEISILQPDTFILLRLPCNCWNLAAQALCNNIRCSHQNHQMCDFMSSTISLSTISVYLCCRVPATLTHILYISMPLFLSVARRCSYSFCWTHFLLSCLSPGTDWFRALGLTSDGIIQLFHHSSGITLVWAIFLNIQWVQTC